MASWIERDDAFIAAVPAPEVDPLHGAADYERWIDQMEVALCRHGLYHVVTGETKEPTLPHCAALSSFRDPTFDDPGQSNEALAALGAQLTTDDLIKVDKQYESYERQLDDFRSQNERAWAIIVMNVSDVCRVHVRGTRNAHAAWNKLEQLFGGSPQQRAQNAWNNLAGLSYSQCSSLSEYCIIHRSCVQSLEKATKQELPKILWVCSLIEGLKGSYSSRLETQQFKARETGQFIDHEELVQHLHYIESSKVKDPKRPAAGRGRNFGKQAKPDF